MGVVGEAKEYGPWRATMELTRGRGPFPTVMARVEAPSDMKEEREMAAKVYSMHFGPKISGVELAFLSV